VTSVAGHAFKRQLKAALAPLARIATRNCARVLMYHRFGPEDPRRRLSANDLDRQLRFLRRHFNVRPLAALAARLRDGLPPEPGTVAVTVDDAYADFGEHAYPVFRENRVPVTIYVVSEFAGGRFWLWWDAVRYLLAQAAPGTYRLGSAASRAEFAIGAAASRDEAWSRLAAIGVALAPLERDQFLCELQSVLAVELPADPTREYSAMNWDRLKSLDPEIVDIGAHTRTHPILARCDTALIEKEVAGSKSEIESRIGRRVGAFCYPNGEPADVDERCIAAVRAAGFDSAVLACGDMADRRSDRFALERMGAAHDQDEFKADVSGVAYLRRRIAG
jgi:peptidoglycan/xylan/chitin deacetylase (PgdA/CDA1 family)